METGEEALAKLEADGWSVTMVGLNVTADPASQVYLAYKVNTGTALTNVIVSPDVGDSFKDENGIVYNCVSHVDVDEGIAGGEVCDSGSYVTKVRLSYSEKREDAINLLKKDKYDYFDVNLTPYSGYTYLGYQLGSAANALTDIRVSNSGSNAIVFGDASYGKMGQDGKGTTPDGLSLFATASKSARSPIVSISIEKKRLGLGSVREPVRLFSGGDAVDIGTKWKDNILECCEDDNVEFFLLKGGWTTSDNRVYMFVDRKDSNAKKHIRFEKAASCLISAITVPQAHSDI